MNVPNRSVIRRLAIERLKASPASNAMAVVAIMLTTILFTSLFIMTLSINDSIQLQQFKHVGTQAHAGFKNISKEQCDLLREDLLVQRAGIRRVLGMVEAPPFHKSHVEVSFMDTNHAELKFCTPIEGHLPAPGSDEVATDTTILALLNITPEIGARVTLPIEIDGQTSLQTFTLSGWWSYDSAIVANQVLISEKRLDGILSSLQISPPGNNGYTGTYHLDVMLPNAHHIQQDVAEILARHGFQDGDRTEGDSYVTTGINWGYTEAQITAKTDPTVTIFFVLTLILICCTGFLIIYNIFGISVANDVQFYGLLKTVGTTPRQLRRMVQIQALLLSAIGIGLGFIPGWLLACVLTPRMMTMLEGMPLQISARPLIFIGAALFSTATVLMTSFRPEGVAAKASPVEAARYAEGGCAKRNTTGMFPARWCMASMVKANLSRTPTKTIMTVASLALALVLFQFTVFLSNGFDEARYLEKFTASDFLLADALQLQTAGTVFDQSRALPADLVAQIAAEPGVTGGDVIYGTTTGIKEKVTPEHFKKLQRNMVDEATFQDMLARQDRLPDGRLSIGTMVYGMPPFALDRLTVVEGDLQRLYEPGAHVVAVVYPEDDYGQPMREMHDARIGDILHLTHHNEHTVAPQEIAYEVVALVTVPRAFGYRFGGLDFESKETYHASFERMQSLFRLLGMTLSVVVALIGLINFINVLLTGVMARRREFAVMQAVGMTGKQLRHLLMMEGLSYTVAALLLALFITVVFGPVTGNGLETLFWFFRYCPVWWPLLLALPILAACGILLPPLLYRLMIRRSIVERLRTL